MMETIDHYLLMLHSAAGTVSPILCWTPVFSRKGGTLHVRVGKIYIITMYIVVISAMLLCLFNVYFGDYLSAGFLGFISLLTIAPLWYGINILKHKRDMSRKYFLVRRWLHASITTAAIGLLIWGATYGFKGETIILLIFGILGLTTSRDVFASYDKISSIPWIKEHLVGMLSTGIAAYTAFLVFGGTQLFADFFRGQAVAILWAAPTVVGTILIMRMTKKYAPSLAKD